LSDYTLSENATQIYKWVTNDHSLGYEYFKGIIDKGILELRQCGVGAYDGCYVSHYHIPNFIEYTIRFLFGV